MNTSIDLRTTGMCLQTYICWSEHNGDVSPNVHLLIWAQRGCISKRTSVDLSTTVMCLQTIINRHCFLHLHPVTRNDWSLGQKELAPVLFISPSCFISFFETCQLRYALIIVLGKWPTWRTILFYVFIAIHYTFRATSCSSSGESIVSIQHPVYVTPCRWPFLVQVGKEL